jgi:A/G-specific adenine glycosylase
VCLPKGPLCLQCPVQPLCRTRGEHVAAPRKKMQTREVACVLSTRGAGDAMEVLLEQRSESASLMAGMWQLPEAELRAPTAPGMTVRHAITTTNYKVHVYVDRQLERERATNCSSGASGEGTRRWFSRGELGGIPLTGLARKVLRRVEISAERTGEGPLP